MAACLLVVIGLPACQTTGEGTDPPRHLAEVVANVIPTADVDMALMDAVNAQVANCMVTAGYTGFAYPRTLAADYVLAVGIENVPRILHAFTMSGPDLKPSIDIVMLSAENQAPQPVEPLDIEGLSLAEQDVYWSTLYGPNGNHGGCLGEALEHVYGSIDLYHEYHSVIGAIQPGADERAAQDRRTRAALDEWKRCMYRMDQVLDDPYEALGSPVVDEQSWTRTAEADSICKEESLLPDWFAAAWIDEVGVDASDLTRAARIMADAGK